MKSGLTWNRQRGQPWTQMMDEAPLSLGRPESTEPKTEISASLSRLIENLETHGEVISEPIYGKGGKGALPTFLKISDTWPSNTFTYRYWISMPHISTIAISTARATDRHVGVFATLSHCRIQTPN
eukprot:1359189-Amorphochlora_amoeboformis.AAC.2